MWPLTFDLSPWSRYADETVEGGDNDVGVKGCVGILLISSGLNTYKYH